MVDQNSLPKSEYYKRFEKVEIEFFRLNWYESFCKFANKYVKLKSPKFLRKIWDDAIFMSGLKTNSDEVFSLLIFSIFVSFLFLFPFAIFLEFPTNILILLGIPVFIGYNVYSYPNFYSDIIRIKAGNEMVDIILYMVIYLSLNPVFEKAVEFAAMNCYGPIGEDYKKIIWDVDMGKYISIKEAIGAHTRKWTIWNEEFVTSLITLQMVGMTSSEKRKHELLEEALDRTLRNTYTKMEEYAIALKMPSMMLMSFGIILPLMGLIMFPIISIFLTDSVNPLYIIIGYTIILPFLLWWYLYRLVSRRPSAFSHSSKTGGIKPAKYIYIRKYNLKLPIKITAILIGTILIIPGLLYIGQIIFDHHFIYSYYDGANADDQWKEYCLERYGSDHILWDLLSAMFIVWGIGSAVIIYTYFTSKDRYQLEEYIRKTEANMIDGLFELQNPLAQNVPIEIALPKVLNKYDRMNRKKTPVYDFFSKIFNSISRLSMTFRSSLFDERYGLMKDYPSSTIKNVMSIIADSLTKGPLIVAGAIKNIIRSMKKTEKIEARIKYLLEDVVTNLKTQTTFIAPLMGGISAATGVLIVQLLQSIAFALSKVEKIYSVGGAGSAMFQGLDIIHLEGVMPPTVMELTIGIYLIEVVVIMCIFIVGIDRGFDEVCRNYTISRNLTIALTFFSVIMIIMVMIFQPIVLQISSV